MTARRHHFLPQAYLKGFTPKPPRLQVIDLVDRKTFVASAEKIAVERDFNRVDLPGVPIDELEQKFARIEGDVIAAIRRIHDARTLEVVADLHLVLNLVGLLWCRNPRARQSRNDSMARLAKGIATASVASRESYEMTLGHPRHERPNPVPYEDMKAFIEGEKYTVTLAQNWQIGAELASVIQVVEVMARRKWSLLRAGTETGGFITCDHPVCLNWTQKIQGPPTLVSANTSLIFPLGKDLCLLGEVGGETTVADIDRRRVALVNGALVANADRYVFAADERFFFLPLGADLARQGRELLNFDRQ